MDLYNETEFSVTVDDFKFIIISKHIIGEKNYIVYKSINNKTKKEIQMSAYTSTSELGCWRFCKFSGRMIEKFDNYIQSTILDFRLQDLMWKIFDKLPETPTPPVIPGKTAIKISACPNDIEGSISSYVYKRKILLPDHINKDNYDIIDRYEIVINNNIDKIKQSKIIFTNYKATISVYKVENEIFGIRIKHKTTGLKLIVQIGSFKITYNAYNYAQEKEEVKEKKGYYILNILPENYKVTELGLYNKYYVETMDFFYDDGYDPREFYVTKPLDYKHQVYVPVNPEEFYNPDAEINDPDYYYIGFLNDKKFIIDQLILGDKHTEETSDKEHLPGLSGGNYKSKYLKYKKKYLELKTKTNV